MTTEPHPSVAGRRESSEKLWSFWDEGIFDSKQQGLSWPLGRASDCWFCNGEQGPKGLFVGCDLKDLIFLPLQKVHFL